MPTFGSLFAGIGGIDLGLERAGWTGRFQVEIDPFCRRVLAKHWPDVPRYGDITTVDWSGVERVDLLAGGFPCQPVSDAGLRLAQKDPRWLWPEFARAICALQPRLVLVENVPGLLGRGMGDVLGDLAALGYDAEWDCLPAPTVGAPHLRDRVFLVAYPERRGPQGRIFERGWANAELAAPHRRDRFGFEYGPSWEFEPDVGLLAHGVSDLVDRLRALGNAVVPQVVEVIGRRLLEVMP